MSKPDDLTPLEKYIFTYKESKKFKVGSDSHNKYMEILNNLWDGLDSQDREDASDYVLDFSEEDYE